MSQNYNTSFIFKSDAELFLPFLFMIIAEQRFLGLKQKGHSLYHELDTFAGCTWLHANCLLNLTAVPRFILV